MKPSNLNLVALAARSGWVWLVVSCLIIVLSSLLPAMAQEKLPPATSTPGDPLASLGELVELADHQVDIKRAATLVVDAQVAIAHAKLRLLKAKLESAKGSQRQAMVKLERMRALGKSGTLSNEAVLEAETMAASAEGLLRESAEAIPVGEAEVELELARRGVARAELAESETRLKQLRQRLKANK